ncbi:MAG: hypothetical protein R6U57_05870 [Anaerolineales bacterium]
MIGRGQFTFIGYLAQRNKNLLLVYIPGDEEKFIKDTFVKAYRTWFTRVEERDLERLDRGRMIYGSGYIYTESRDLPEIRLRKLIVLQAKKEGIEPPAHVDMVDVKEHLRDLPAGMHASEKQRRKALKAGIVLPEGYTFVSSYEREKERDLTEGGQE